ncbi:thermoresistant gluconokinase [Microsporum canis CBS 113480]|uniref:Gluconokinase n=1 Tax=Arthroderma otae (strain ATCC MYA-4605 / CBS 113480) TaxID=554155 RepID=C5FU82_ARTOC|nr:thermoresistant gluconokinase [Microsporum canis CBS 113480]EEQ33466.1 thermoresistant gluconokinase [Microsporum canis CBS 113480]
MLSTEQPSTGPYMPATRSPLPLQNMSRNSLSRRYPSATTPSPSPSLSSSASYALKSQQNPNAMPQHIWIVTGPAGCGKTTVAQGLAKELRIPYIEGDDYHSKSNKEKMTNSIPLTDADRWDWLIQLREAAISALTTPSSSSPATPRSCPPGVVATCSALKHKYRDVIRVAAYDHPTVRIHFIYLRAPEEVLLQRVRQRKGHYMKSTMVHSQFEMLEEPDSEWDALSVDCAASPAEVQRRVNSIVQQKLDEYSE